MNYIIGVTLNYLLLMFLYLVGVPGEYQVTPQYLPEGLTDTGHNQYRGENEEWVTIMPIYTMDELDRAGASIEVNGIENVEHTVLSGMEAESI